MKLRTITTQPQLDKAAEDLRKLGGLLPLVITVTQGARLRSSSANAAYWAEMDMLLQNIREAINRIAEESGHTEAEVRWLVAQEMRIEYRGIMFVLSKEAAHEMMKMICGIPTSTRLGTKEFSKFTDRMAQVMSEILSDINAITR